MSTSAQPNMVFSFRYKSRRFITLTLDIAGCFRQIWLQDSPGPDFSCERASQFVTLSFRPYFSISYREPADSQP